MANYQNLDQTKSFEKLHVLAKQPLKLSEILSPERIKNYLLLTKLLSFFYACALVDDEILGVLQELADEQTVIEKYENLLAGARVNVGEDRAVLHHKVRGRDRGIYGQEQKRFSEFSEKVHKNEIKGFSGKPFEAVVQIGIGGSDLGPRALYLALERYAKVKESFYLKADFISNVDPDDANKVLDGIDFEKTIFILVSKSGTTLETLTNQEIVIKKAAEKGISFNQLRDNFVCITAKGSPLDKKEEYLDVFNIDDAIGGRYSVTSAVGGVLLSLAFGSAIFEQILEGANLIDEAAKEPDILKNMALLFALIGVWERNFLGFSSKAIIPYSDGLLRFPAHLQQLDGESNGKQVNIYNEPINYETAPVIFGEPGTNSQHSFFQMLHQGTTIIPIQFIGFKSSQTKLNANLSAQIVAFALGKSNENLSKNFPGNRPTTLVYAKHLCPRVLGALLAFYENMVMFQGFIWNINSFDQEGVQLGKSLANSLLSPGKKPSGILSSVFELLV